MVWGKIYWVNARDKLLEVIGGRWRVEAGLFGDGKQRSWYYPKVFCQFTMYKCLRYFR